MNPKISAFVVIGALAFVSASVRQAEAGGVLHKVKDSNETYARLAEHYYGDRRAAHHLMVKNHYREPLEPGITLVIPTWTTQRLAKGESLEAFAKDKLGEARRAEYLRLLHGLTPGKEPKGARLRVPPTLRHKVRVGESYASIARTYFNSSSQQRQELLRLYNGLPKGGLRVGTHLRIPLDSPPFADSRVRRRAKVPLNARAEVAAKAPPEAPPPPTRRGRGRSKGKSAVSANPTETRAPANPQAELESAQRLFEDGQYEDALKSSRKLAGAKQEPEVRVESLKLLACTLVAFGRFDEAERKFRQLLKLSPGYRLDLYRTSPKILDVFESARR